MLIVLVDFHVAFAPGAGKSDHQRTRAKGFGEFLLRLLEGFRRVFALGDFTNCGDNVAASQVNVFDIDFDRKGRAVFTPMASLDDYIARVAQPLVNVVAHRVVERGIDIVGSHRQHFLAGIPKVETSFLIDIEELQRDRVKNLNSVVGTVHQFSEQAHGFLGKLARGNVHTDANQATGHALFDDDVDDLLQPYGSAIDGNHAVLEFVIAVFLDGFCREDQSALTILGMEVLDPERGILQPTLDGVTEDIFDLLVDESGLESNGVRATQDGTNRFNELAVQSVQFARVALQARLGELLSEEGKNREEEAEGENDNQTKCTQAGGFILSKDLPYADDGDRDYREHHQQRNVLAVL